MSQRRAFSFSMFRTNANSKKERVKMWTAKVCAKITARMSAGDLEEIADSEGFYKKTKETPMAAMRQEASWTLELLSPLLAYRNSGDESRSQETLSILETFSGDRDVSRLALSESIAQSLALDSAEQSWTRMPCYCLSLRAAELKCKGRRPSGRWAQSRRMRMRSSNSTLSC